ncbi:MAG: winged helix-turn-helix domain-containing protein [Acidobacteriota bacterium]
MKRTSRHYAFGSYVIDGLRGVLWEGATAVPLTPRVFDLLVALVEQHGEVLEKDEIIRKVWGDAIVEENNLARHISTLRKALHERPGQRDFIATIPGVGYRFVAEVLELEKLPPDLTHAPLKKAVESPASVAATVVPAPVSSPRRSPWAAAAVVVMLAAAGMTASRWWSSPERPAQRALTELTYGPGLQREPAWSPDGRFLAFASDRNGNSDIWVQNVEDGSANAVTTSPDQESQPDWSPDGQWLVFRSEREGGGLYVIPALGGEPRRVAAFGSRPRWSPKGDQILFSYASPTTGGGLKMFVVDRAGSNPHVIGSEALGDFNTLSAAWHPDGRVSFWGQRERNGGWEFATVSLTTGRADQSAIGDDTRAMFSRDRLELSAFTWAQSARFLYFEGQSKAVRSLWRVAVDPATLAWQGEPERLTTGPGTDGGAAVSRDGNRLAFGVASGRSVVWSFPFDPVAARVTGSGIALTSGDPQERGVDVWMDGQRLVYLASRNDRQEMWERSNDAQPQLLLATTDSTRSPPRWSPDGTRIAYHRRPKPPGSLSDGTVAVFTLGDKHEELLVTPRTGEVVPSDWSSDGRRLLTRCRLRAQDRSGTCIMPVSGSPAEIRLLSSSERLDMMQQRFSPNQRWISFIAVAPGDHSVATIYVMPATGGEWTPITDGASYDDKPRWSPDGRTLYFISNREGRSNVWAQRFDAGVGRPIDPPFRVTSFDQGRQTITPYIEQLTMSVTKSRLVLPMYEATGQIWILDRVDR